MAITFTTLETTLQSKINTSTDTKELLLATKAIESSIGNLTVQDVINEGTTQVSAINTAGTTQVSAVNTAGSTQVSAVTTEGDTQVARATTEGNTQVAAVIAAGAGYADLTGAVFTGGITGTTATFSGNVNAQADLIVSGNLTVSGTTTTITSTTVEIEDTNIVIALNATNATEANGAGITVNGASAQITYVASTDTWNFNKAISGSYNQLHPVVVVSASTVLSMNAPVTKFAMTGAATFTTSALAAGRVSMLLLDRSASGYTPTFGAEVKWPKATVPTWADGRYWLITLTCYDATSILATASPYTI